MSNSPLISVIVPCYNQGRYLDEALNSVYNQSYVKWECIVINDGSTDNSEEIALGWTRKDKRFVYFYQNNTGLSSARNKGLQQMSGSYIQFLDADDIIDSRKFRSSLEFAPDAGVIISNFKRFTNKGEHYTDPTYFLKENLFNFYAILTGWDEQFAIPIHCALFKTSLFRNIRFNESLRAKEDWVMWLQLYQQLITTAFLDQPYALYRYTGDSMSQNRRHMYNNLVFAYQLIYELIPLQYKGVFFKKAIHALGEALNESENLLEKTRNSKSYKFGNFFIHPFTRMFKSKFL